MRECTHKHTHKHKHKHTVKTIRKSKIKECRKPNETKAKARSLSIHYGTLATNLHYTILPTPNESCKMETSEEPALSNLIQLNQTNLTSTPQSPSSRLSHTIQVELTCLVQVQVQVHPRRI